MVLVFISSSLETSGREIIQCSWRTMWHSHVVLPTNQVGKILRGDRVAHIVCCDNSLTKGPPNRCYMVLREYPITNSWGSSYVPQLSSWYDRSLKGHSTEVTCPNGWSLLLKIGTLEYLIFESFSLWHVFSGVKTSPGVKKVHRIGS